MRKYLIIGIMVLMMLVPIASALNTISIEKTELQKSLDATIGQPTHTVIVEYGTITTCPYCAIASNQLYSLYNSGDLDFYYVSLVGDEGNLNIYSRLKELGVTAVPDVFFDGKYKDIKGAQSNEQPYRNAITQAGERAVPDIDVDINAEWKGKAAIKITVTVQNNEPEKYAGKLRVYIVEKESRWNDKSGNPFHYAALDIPIDRSLAAVSQHQSCPMPLGNTRTFTKTWYGALHGFGDITKENTLVIAAVFDSDTDYAVQADAAEPTGEGSIDVQYQTINAMFSLIKSLPDNHPINNILNRILST